VLRSSGFSVSKLRHACRNWNGDYYVPGLVICFNQLGKLVSSLYNLTAASVSLMSIPAHKYLRPPCWHYEEAKVVPLHAMDGAGGEEEV
jgi:hypothetical protein